MVMTAARSGTAEGVRLLVEAGADVHARETSRDQTALMWAVTQGHHQVVQILLEAGADMEARSKVRPRLMYDVGPNAAVFDQGVIVNLGGFTPLLFAARHGDAESARLLLAAGADVDNPAANGASPLVVAIHSGHTAFAVLLLAEGAEPDAIGAGYTALHAAVLRGDLTTVIWVAHCVCCWHRSPQQKCKVVMWLLRTRREFEEPIPRPDCCSGTPLVGGVRLRTL